MDFILKQEIKVLAGRGTAAQLGELVTEAGYKKPFVVFDRGVEAAGIVTRIRESLNGKSLEFAEFGGVKPDPSADIVDAAADMCVAAGCDCVIAVGGGSSIDTAKGVNILRINGGRILDYADPTHPMRKCNGLVSVPTTSGTGSELSDGLIITDQNAGVKVPILALNGMSEYAVIDAELTVGMPPMLTATTGLDVFSHAFEAYTSVRANPMNAPICEKLMETVVEYLPRAVADGTDLEARERMVVAASMGGWMLANTGSHVGHALAHVIGAHFHVPHGIACSMDVPAMFGFIAACAPEKIRYTGRLLGAVFTGEETPEQIARIAGEAYVHFRDVTLGMKPVQEYQIDVIPELDALCEAVAHEPLASLCPRPVTAEAARSLLTEIFG